MPSAAPSTEKLSTTDRLLGSVTLLRWMKAGKSAIKAEELRDAMKAEKASGKIDGWPPRQAYDKVPPARAAHIPLDEWLKWKAWNKP
ncbi:hypothetical protein ACWGBH_03650 [Streptomyces massasporeus]